MCHISDAVGLGVTFDNLLLSISLQAGSGYDKNTRTLWREIIAALQ